MDNALVHLRNSAGRYDAALAEFRKSQKVVPADLNSQLIQTERALTSPEGLPNREWFKHQIYAPGFYTGYGVKTIPTVREAIEQKEWENADKNIAKVAVILDNFSELIDSAAVSLEGSKN